MESPRSNASRMRCSGRDDALWTGPQPDCLDLRAPVSRRAFLELSFNLLDALLAAAAILIALFFSTSLCSNFAAQILLELAAGSSPDRIEKLFVRRRPFAAPVAGRYRIEGWLRHRRRSRR